MQTGAYFDDTLNSIPIPEIEDCRRLWHPWQRLEQDWATVGVLTAYLPCCDGGGILRANL